jgi:hypothetical protein
VPLLQGGPLFCSPLLGPSASGNASVIGLWTTLGPWSNIHLTKELFVRLRHDRFFVVATPFAPGSRRSGRTSEACEPNRPFLKARSSSITSWAAVTRQRRLITSKQGAGGRSSVVPGNRKRFTIPDAAVRAIVTECVIGPQQDAARSPSSCLLERFVDEAYQRLLAHRAEVAEVRQSNG